MVDPNRFLEDELELESHREDSGSPVDVDWQGGVWEEPPAPDPGGRPRRTGITEGERQRWGLGVGGSNRVESNGTDDPEGGIREETRRAVNDARASLLRKLRGGTESDSAEPASRSSNNNGGRTLGGGSPYIGRLPGTSFEEVKFLATIKDLKVTASGDGQFTVIVPYRWVDDMLTLRHGQMMVLSFAIKRHKQI